MKKYILDFWVALVATLDEGKQGVRLSKCLAASDHAPGDYDDNHPGHSLHLVLNRFFSDLKRYVLSESASKKDGAAAGNETDSVWRYPYVRVATVAHSPLPGTDHPRIFYTELIRPNNELGQKENVWPRISALRKFFNHEYKTKRPGSGTQGVN